MDAIFSKANENVKLIKSLNDKKSRVKNNAFYLEGIKVVNEILDKRKAIDIMFIAYSKSLLLSSNGGQELLNRIEKEDVKALEFEENIFKYMTDTVTPQGVLIVLKLPKYDLDEVLNESSSSILILDQIQDLGNLGTIIRSANAFDVETIICTPNTADVFSPKCLRSTMGGILNTKIIYISNVSELEKVKAHGYKIVSTSLEAKGYIENLDFNNKYAYVMGNEANGVSKEVFAMSDEYIKIPMTDKIESLNVGVATSIVLYEQFKNRK